MLACISKNDRAEPLFGEIAKLTPDALRLGRVAPLRILKLTAAIASLSPSLAQTRTDMEFSPILAFAGQRLTEGKLRETKGVTHVLQWGAMYAPVKDARRLAYSLVTDGPFDPMDAAYPMEWKPRRWGGEYFARQRRIYHEATRVFTLSEWARQKLLELHSLDPERVVRIGWGPMFAAEPATKSAAGMGASKLFLSLGNEWRRKGMDLVARAGTRLHAEDAEVSIVIAGDPEGMHVAASEGVTLLPRRLPLAEVKLLLGRARALVVASRFDASPHIVMEALQMGVPVIASDVCGLPEAVQVPLGGRIVRVGDTDDLLVAMREMLRGELQSQREGALRAYAAMGGWGKAAQRVVESLKSCGAL